MATPNFAKKNPFMGMTVKQMKTYYDNKVRGKKLSAKQLKAMADQMQAAKKAAPKAKPRQTTRAEAERRFYSSSSQGYIAKNQEKAKSNFFRSSSGTRGQNMPSNPALKSQPKKPSRSNFATGRTGSTRFAEAMRKYRASRARMESAKPKVKRNRRGRRI